MTDNDTKIPKKVVPVVQMVADFTGREFIMHRMNLQFFDIISSIFNNLPQAQKDTLTEGLVNIGQEFNKLHSYRTNYFKTLEGSVKEFNESLRTDEIHKVTIHFTNPSADLLEYVKHFISKGYHILTVKLPIILSAIYGTNITYKGIRDRFVQTYGENSAEVQMIDNDYTSWYKDFNVLRQQAEHGKPDIGYVGCNMRNTDKGLVLDMPYLEYDGKKIPLEEFFQSYFNNMFEHVEDLIAIALKHLNKFPAVTIGIIPEAHKSKQNRNADFKYGVLLLKPIGQ